MIDNRKLPLDLKPNLCDSKTGNYGYKDAQKEGS